MVSELFDHCDTVYRPSGGLRILMLDSLLEPAVHGMGAPTGTLEQREAVQNLKILAQGPDLDRGVSSVEPLGSTPRGRFPKMSVQN